jgi:putative ABC transport system ATP-binding protein
VRCTSARQSAGDLLTRLGLDETLWSRQVTALSVGQQQRVAAARALIGAPGVILADEPTSALDTANRDRFMELLLALAEENGSSVVFVSHDPSLASRFGNHLKLEATP